MPEIINIEYKEYLITTDKKLMQFDDIYYWLSKEAYWSKNIPYETVKTAFENSYCIGALKDKRQIAYARFVTDYSVFAYLADVYVEAPHRRKGISKKMIETLMQMDWVKDLRRIMLATVDAHDLYAQFDFAAPKFPDRLMEIIRPNIYGDNNNICK